jgi:hypothetical protein
MKSGTSDRTVRVDVTLPGSGILVTLAKVPSLALRVLRGRVTAGRAWYRLEVSGQGSAVEQALGVLRGAAS